MSTRQKNKENRDYISGMTTQQRKNFFKGFDTEEINATEKAIEGARKEMKKDERASLESQIAALQAKMADMS